MAVYSRSGFAHGTDAAAPDFDNDKWYGNLMQLGYTGVFKTDKLTSSSSAAGSSDFMTVYSSGHWGQQAMFDVSLITTYYRPSIITWRCCMNYSTFKIVQLKEGAENGQDAAGPYLVSGSPKLILHNDADNATATFAYNTNNDNTSGYRDLVSTGGHSGQNVFKQNLRFETAGPYYQTYALIKIFAGGGNATCFFSDSSVSNLDSNRASNGSAFHFKTISRRTNYHSDSNV